MRRRWRNTSWFGKKRQRSAGGNHRRPPNVLILDHVLSEGELGLDFLPEFKDLLPHVPIIIVSGALEVRQQLAALQGPRRAHYCLPKPVGVHDLRRTVETALRECGETEVVRQFKALERSHRTDALDLFSRATDRLSRQNRLLELLEKSRNGRTSPRSPAISVARRTIIRDLQQLIHRGQLKPEIYPEWENPPTGED